jgi:hypothetical protein
MLLPGKLLRENVEQARVNQPAGKETDTCGMNGCVAVAWTNKP